MAEREVLDPAGPGRRIWQLPVRAHVAALAVVLVALVPLIGTGSSFSADEGAAIVQARSLSRGDGWIVEHPVPEADPAGVAYPLELSQQGSKGTTPFAKHPVYALLLAGADRVAGTTGMVLLSVLGTVAAAALAALLAARIDPGLSRPTLWAAGVASPLLFDGYLVIAHSLGAACAAGAVLAAAVAIERRSRVTALAVAPCVGAAVLLRSEAVFLALGLAVAAAVVGARRGNRVVALLVAAGSIPVAMITRVGERAWIAQIVGTGGGGTGAASPPAESTSFVADQWQAFVITWLRPSYGAAPVVELLLVLVLGALLLGAYAVRRGRPGTGPIVVTAAACAVAAMLLDPTNVVPGLLVACPLVLAGLALLGRAALTTTTARLAAITAGVFALCVLATQYSTGGSGEWGGRYFALALPVILPVLVLAIRQRGSKQFIGALVVCSLALSVMSIGSLRSAHRFGSGLIAAIDRTAGPDRPVLVTTTPLMPRLAWPTFDRQRWLLSQPTEVAALVDRLGAAGIDRFTYVARTEADVALLPPTVTQETSAVYRGWRILVIRTA